MTLRGIIREHSPVIQGRARAGLLHLGGRGPVPLVIDTGFTGAFAVPEAIARSLDLEFAGFDTFTLATGQEVELPVFVGTVVLGGRRVKTWFILGEGLVGMEFLEEACADLLLDFEKQALRLRLKKRGRR
ncbi:MAG TPA: hypothetical protein VED18_08555 [Candidatus Sulfotelmatobacter sp.]|nr:hypothetical protein [Candidatus Sulfotelmatobacter sp.]